MAKGFDCIWLHDFIKYQNYEADIVMTFYLSLKKR